MNEREMGIFVFFRMKTSEAVSLLFKDHEKLTLNRLSAEQGGHVKRLVLQVTGLARSQWNTISAGLDCTPEFRQCIIEIAACEDLESDSTLNVLELSAVLENIDAAITRAEANNAAREPGL